MSSEEPPERARTDEPQVATVEPDAAEAEEERKDGWFLRELPILILIAFGLAILIKTFLMQAFYIPSESMLPTLEVRDRVLVNKLVYRFREPRRGEIVVFVAQRGEPKSFGARVKELLFEGFGAGTPGGERDFIKRVIAVPGDTVEVRRKGVFVTPPGGERTRIAEGYLYDGVDQGDRQEPITLGPDEYFVMGDNRANSSDSRARGPIHRRDIIGKAFVRIWPPGRLEVFDTPAYPELEAARGSPSRAGGILEAWSPTDASRSGCGRPASATSQAWTRPAGAPWQGRSSPARSSCLPTSISPA